MLKAVVPIPVVFTINDKYTLPVIVCITSLLDNARVGTQYQIIIISDDLSSNNKRKITKHCKKYRSFSSILFTGFDNELIEPLWNLTRSKNHFSKDIIVRLTLANLLPDHKIVILSDADVVYCDDISDSLTAVDDNDEWYIAGVKSINDIRSFYDHSYKDRFPQKDIELLKDYGFSAGYCIFNLEKIRQDGMTAKYIDYYQKNAESLVQPEQDVLCLCSHPNLQYLPMRFMVYTYIFTLTEEKICSDLNHPESSIREAIEKPVQIHYVATPKPWESRNVILWDRWYYYLKKTNMLFVFWKTYFYKEIITSNRRFIRKLKGNIRNLIYG